MCFKRFYLLIFLLYSISCVYLWIHMILENHWSKHFSFSFLQNTITIYKDKFPPGTIHQRARPIGKISCKLINLRMTTTQNMGEPDLPPSLLTHELSRSNLRYANEKIETTNNPLYGAKRIFQNNSASVPFEGLSYLFLVYINFSWIANWIETLFK